MPKDPKAEILALADLLDEIKLVSTILHFARAGRATDLMVEQAIALLDQQIPRLQGERDAGMLKNVTEMKAGLKQALVDGVKSLRVVAGPGPEILQVQDPLARKRSEAGNRVRVQRRCAHGIIDIFDITADEIIECKHIGTAAALGEAAGQLRRYSQSFPGSGLVIAVLRIEGDGVWLAEILRAQGITIIEMDRS